MLQGDEEPLNLFELSASELLGGLWFEVHCGRLETWVAPTGEQHWRVTPIGEVYYGGAGLLASEASAGSIRETARKWVALA
jgi:hypothetical protein